MAPPNASYFATGNPGLCKEARDTHLSAILAVGVLLLLGSGLWFALKRFVPSIALRVVKTRIEKLWHILVCIKHCLPVLIRLLAYSGLLLFAYIIQMLLALIVAVELG